MKGDGWVGDVTGAVADLGIFIPLVAALVLVNGMSANTGMPWDLEPGRRVLGYHPQDDVTRHTTPWAPSSAGA